MSLLNYYGWNSHFEQSYTSYKNEGLKAGRVYSIQGYKYFIVADEGEFEAELSGALINSKENWELPKVGDWIVFVPMDANGYIIDVLPRQNELARKVAGKSFEKQVLVANVDYAFVVQGLDKDFNLMRLQRYLHQIYESGITPIVILNKCDLAEDPAIYINKVMELGYKVSVLLTSTITGKGLAALKYDFMEKGKAYVLLGSSGVGKSSILNALLEEDIQSTEAVSEANKKGRHTTTFRYLTKLTNGSILIDTPGMREFGLTAEADEDAKFIHPQIEELSHNCKFLNCSHISEPDCAVKEAVRSGKLAEIVYQSYLKLLKEQQRFSISTEEKRRNERQFGKISREANNHRKKRKY